MTREIKQKPKSYITLKEISDHFLVPKVTVNYYVLRGILIPEFSVGKTNLFDKKTALKIVGKILKTKGQPLNGLKSNLKN